MPICIIDPASHFPSLKHVFPDSDYYSHEPDSFFTFTLGNHYTKDEIKNKYRFDYRTDWNTITSDNFDTVFVVLPLIDYLYSENNTFKENADRMINKIRTLFIQNEFKTIVLFDTHTNDYDPSNINENLRVDYYFKRNYTDTAMNVKNVFPFPYTDFKDTDDLNSISLYVRKNIDDLNSISLSVRKNISIHHDKVTVFLTACKRPDLLELTLKSFIKFNTYPIEEVIIMEDSGQQGINDFIHSFIPYPTKIIYAKKNRGVMKSIENGLQYIKTPYVFQCEDDWEFFDYGFIEKSLEILKKNDKITVVQLRNHNDLKGYNIPLVDVGDYFTCGTKEHNVGNFTNNPGLRTVKSQKMFAPYTKDSLVTLCEGGLSLAFRKEGMTSAVTYNVNGYVRHAGDGRRVYNTLGIETF